MTQKAISVRYARPSEAKALNRVAAQWFNDTYAHQNTQANMDAYIAKHFDGRELSQQIDSREHGVLVLRADADYVGYAVVETRAADSGNLQRFYIDANWHGSGLAARLMEAVVTHGLCMAHSAITLGVYTENPRAIRFYEKHGFRIVGEERFQFGSEAQRDWLMQRDLDCNDWPDDAAFVERFLACHWPPAAWTHAAHVRLAWTLLASESLEATLDKVRTAIMRYNTDVLERPAAYHETLTVAFVSLIHAARRADQSFAEFARANPTLMADDPLAVCEHYSAERLDSAAARREFVLPDIAPLPKRGKPAPESEAQTCPG